MGTTSDKLFYLNETKTKIKDAINLGNTNITNETFRQYENKIKQAIINTMNDKWGVWNNFDKVIGTNETLTLNNTEYAPMQVNLKGNTSQDSTTGKNKVKLVVKTESNNGLTYTSYDDNTFKVTGTINTNTQTSILLTSDYNYIPYLDKNMTLSCGYNTTGNVGAIVTLAVNNNGALIANNLFNIDAGNNKKTVNLNSSSYDISNGFKLRHQFYIPPNKNGTSINITGYLQLEEGTSATELEQYTGGSPAPSPSYPFVIHNVSGDNTIEICGKNLFNKSENLQSGRYDSTGTFISDSYWRSSIIQVQPNTAYTFSGVSSSNSAIKQCEFDENMNFIRSQINFENGTITTANNCKYINATCRNNEQMDTFMVEANDQATTYEAYTGNSQLISLGVENMLNLTDGTYTETDITGVVSNGVITINGTASATRFLKINLGTNLSYINNQKYTISLNNQTTNNNVSFRIDNNGTFDTAINTQNTTKTFTYDGTTMLTDRITIRVASGTTLTDFVIKPQLEKGSKANSYSEYGKPYIELNKIEKQDHTIIAQDYFYPSTDRWFLHKEIGKYVYNNDLQDNGSETNYLKILTPVLNVAPNLDLSSLSLIARCNLMTSKFDYANSNYTGLAGTSSASKIRVYINKDYANDYASALTLFANNNLTIYYVLNTPTDTEITDTTLLEQLNNLEQIKSKKNQTNINQENNDLPFIITATALKKIADNA